MIVNATAASVGENLFLSFEGNGGDGLSAQRIGIDNVTVSTIPEPATMALLGLGGLLSLKRRRS